MFSTTLTAVSLIIRRIQRDVVINIQRFYVQYLLFFSDFNKI